MDFLFLALIFAVVGLMVGLGAYCEHLRNKKRAKCSAAQFPASLGAPAPCANLQFLYGHNTNLDVLFS
jgi:hypothetical protein